MKNVLLILIASLFLYSCTEVIFEAPQPPGVKSMAKIPQELQGKYSFVILNEETVMEIGSNFITGDDDKAYISDSLVVKKVDNKYVVNKLISEGEGKTGKWQVYVLEDKGCGFVKATSFIINSDTYSAKFAEKYGAEQIGEGQEKNIIVNPSAKQFNTIMEDDSVTISIILERLQ